jgi:hypothetical protein
VRRHAAAIALFLLAACGRSHFDPCDPGGTVDAPAADTALDLTLGLKARYTFDDPAPDLFVDIAGTNDALCSSCPLQVGGRIGPGAINFAGTQCVFIPDALELRPTAFTIAMWMNPGNATGVLFARPLDGTNTNSNSIEMLYDTSTTEIRIAVATLATSAATPAGWTHVTARYDGSILTLYVNGSYRSDRQVGGIVYGVADQHQIGCDYDTGSYVSGFTGSLDDLRFYDRALDNAEISALAAM